MRLTLPRFRLPHVRFDRFPAVSGRLILYVLYTLVLFLVFLVANFDYHVLVRRALDGINLGPVHLDVRASRFAWWKGFELREVLVTQADVGLDTPPLLESSHLYVWPSLAGLFKGKITSAEAYGSLYGGRVEGSWVKQGGKTRATAQLDSLQLGLHPLVVGLFEEGELAGRLSGLLSFEPRGSGIAGGEAAGDLTLANGRLRGAKVKGFSLPDLQSCAGGAKITLQGERLNIEEFRLDCDELKLGVSGEIISRARLSDSRLNLELKPELGPASSDEWKGLVTVIPCWISGTLAHPRVQQCNVASQVQRRQR